MRSKKLTRSLVNGFFQ